MSRADNRGLSMRQLTEAYRDWRLTLDDEENEEHYDTERGTGSSFVQQFLDWLESEDE